jgi:hypothetical protein
LRPDRARVLLPSGQRLDLLTPDAGAWTEWDLTIGLSRAYRWGGHSRWDLPLSVAQHSLLVLVIRQQMNTLQHLTAAEALRELLHDADEGLLGFDPISPLKRHLGEEFKAVAGRLRAAIESRYRVLPWRCDDYLSHKKADHLAAASEAFHVTGWPRDAIRESLQIRLEPLEHDPLPLLDGMQPWQPWPPRLAAALFLAKLRELTRTDGHVEHPGCVCLVADRERAIRSLVASFSRLPAGKRRKVPMPPAGNSLSDTYMSPKPMTGRKALKASSSTATEIRMDSGTSMPTSPFSRPTKNYSSATATVAMWKSSSLPKIRVDPRAMAFEA